MNIGFDAKRAFLNRSGLGNYSRFIIESLTKFHGEHAYFLYTPRKGSLMSSIDKDAMHIITPQRPFDKLFPAYWRTFGISKDIRKNHIHIFHGLSGEIPRCLAGKGIKKIVTIHDLIFLRYPEFYKPVDRKIYESKFRYSCTYADKIIAISQQTKADIQHFFDVPEEKIQVIYQGCNQRFHSKVSDEAKMELKEKYQLPTNYLLYVGTIEERKNLLNLLKAMVIGNIDTPLVVVGKSTPYRKRIEEYIHTNRIENVYFLSGVPDEDLPGIFQLADLFVYPSVFEGFGIPILEALYSKIPVITSKGSCFSEAGGANSMYIDPANPSEMADAIKQVLSNEVLAKTMIDQGYIHAQGFNHAVLADSLMKTYTELTNE